MRRLVLAGLVPATHALLSSKRRGCAGGAREDGLAVAGGGILASAIRRLHQLSDRLRQLSRGELAGRAFKTVHHGEAGDFAFLVGVKELGIIPERHASV